MKILGWNNIEILGWIEEILPWYEHREPDLE